MSDWHGYIGVEDIALTAPQRAAILTAFRGLGPGQARQPAHLLHMRPSLDGSKAIFEARFNESKLTVSAVKQFIASAVGVAASAIDHETMQSVYGPVVSLRAGGMEQMRFLVFGGTPVSHEESRQQVRAYLIAHIAEWDISTD